MPLALKNFEFQYINSKGKPVFVPTKHCRDVADRLLPLIRDAIEFEPYYYHLARGGHVAGLHVHRGNKYFARLDLKNFFYSIARNRVKRSLRQVGIHDAEGFARWSCVKNPYKSPSYSLPYGFPQSPLLATLVLRQSALGRVIDELPEGVAKSVYLDDVAVSSDDLELLTSAYRRLCEAAVESNFELNEAKLAEPAEAIGLFNCDLSYGRTAVSDERIAEFEAKFREPTSVDAFIRYCASVEAGNLAAV